MVSKLSISRAISIFVPTPSVQVTNIGLFICFGIRVRAENEPRPLIISGLLVFSTNGFILCTSS